jgi:hypothetical protein
MMGENIQFLVYNSNSFLPFSTAAQARTLAPARGIYLVSLFANGQVVHSEKLIIQK